MSSSTRNPALPGPIIAVTQGNVPGQSTATSNATQGAITTRVDETHVNKCHLWWLYDDVVDELYYNVILWSSPGWDEKSNYMDYLHSRGIDIGKLNKTQIAQMNRIRPRETWDITLMLNLIKWSGSLADKNDPKWSAKVGTNPERSLTVLKDTRNDLAHTRKVDRKMRIALMRKVRKLTRKIQTGLRWVRRHSGGPIARLQKKEIDDKFRGFLDTIDHIVQTKLGQGTFDRYGEQLNLIKKMEIIEERLPQLETHLRKITTFSPVTQLLEPFSDCQVEVQDIFTEMVIEDGAGNQKIDLENLLAHLPHDDPECLLLIKGHAGIGKSTVVRKLISDWVNKTGVIKGLESFDMVFHVECRHHIDSFRDLLVTSLGDVHKSLNDKDLITAVLEFKCLAIIDGYDELNSKSSKLVQEILAIKQSSNLSLIFTSRPEAEKKFSNQVKPDFKRITTIRLEGIPKENFEDFVGKYYSCISNQSSQPIRGLLKYLEKTKNKLCETWRSPYNLSILVVLWSFGQNVNSITTEAELHMQIFNLQTSKLEERLQRDECTQALPLSILCKKLDTFLWHLSNQAFTGLKNDDIILSPLAYKELTRVSTNLDLPAEQVLGAFLKEVAGLREKHYSFAHKATQEFYAAYYVLLQLTVRGSFSSILVQSLFKCLPCLKLEGNTHDPVQGTKRSGSLRGILKDLYPEQDSPPEKYQNLFCNIISVSQVTDLKVPHGLLVEVLDLLQESGLKDKDSWIRVLTNIKCNITVANWIANKYGLLEGEININDSSFDAYLSIMNVVNKPLGRKDDLTIKIKLDQLPHSINEMATVIAEHGIPLKRLYCKELWRGIDTLQGDSQESSTSVLLQNCEAYEGVWNTRFQIFSSMEQLRVRLLDNATWNHFFDLLPMATKLKSLRISFGPDFNPTIRKITVSVRSFSVYITDIRKEEEAKKACHIIRGFDRPITYIAFPRCLLDLEAIEGTLDALRDVTVTWSIAFPENLSPKDKKQVEKIRAKAPAGCQFGIVWANEENIWYH